MLDLFWSAIATVTGWLVSILPDSPISQWLNSLNIQGSAISTGLGWLNWLVDVNAMKIILGVWLVAFAAYMVTVFAISVSGSVRNVVSAFSTNINNMLDNG